MSPRAIDIERLRVVLRRMDRGQLLIVAGRAIELVPRTKLRQLLGDMVGLDELAEGKRDAMPLLDEVRTFHDASLRGEYYDAFDVDSRNFTKKSDGTDAFIAEFGRLSDKCIRAAGKGPRPPVREAFELLLALLRCLDEDPDRVAFFADEAGSWQVGVDWDSVLPAYFRCLAEGTSAEDYAREVDRAIADFQEYERPRHLTAARREGNADQKAALRRLRGRATRR